MAFQRVDPLPFVPQGCQYQDVPNHVFMVHAVAPVRPLETNENLGIITFDPLPGNAMNFAAVRAVRDFLNLEMRVAYRDIQPTPLGQALVKFGHAYDRDNMVRLSPMPFGNIHVSFTKHNEGRNWRRIFFNDECWMMLLGFSEDYKSERHIQNAISEFGRIIVGGE